MNSARDVIIHKDMIELSDKKWRKIQELLVEEGGPSRRISWVLKREYGFTPRHDWGKVYLDFYDDKMQTYFQLRFL